MVWDDILVWKQPIREEQLRLKPSGHLSPLVVTVCPMGSMKKRTLDLSHARGRTITKALLLLLQLSRPVRVNCAAWNTLLEHDVCRSIV